MSVCQLDLSDVNIKIDETPLFHKIKIHELEFNIAIKTLQICIPSHSGYFCVNEGPGTKGLSLSSVSLKSLLSLPLSLNINTLIQFNTLRS